MKRIILMVLCAAAISTLTGCIEIIEHITRDERGFVSIFIKLGMSKSITEFASMMEEGLEDPFPDIAQFGEDSIMENLPANAEVAYSKIDNEMEYGFSMTIAYDERVFLKMGQLDVLAPAAFIPISKDNLVVLEFPVSEAPSSDNPLADGMMKTMKYRLTIGKAFLKTISRVVVSSKDFDYKPSIVSLPDMFLIEIPLVYLINGSNPVQIQIYK